MFSQEAQELLQDIVNLFARASKIPVALYERTADGKVEETVRSEERLFPPHCHAIWALNNHKGREVCLANMCRRAELVIESQRSAPLLCHAGLTNITEPIAVNGKPFAAIQYGAFLVDGEADLRERLARHQDAMVRLGASPGEAERIRTLLELAPRRTEAEWEWVRQTLPPILTRILYPYVTQKERERLIQQGAYHDLQLRLQAALAHAENLISELPPTSPLREAVEDIMGAVEAGGTVLHSLTRGEYLPKDYRFKRHALRDFIERAITLCRSEARKKDIEITVEPLLADWRVSLQVSEQHLQQACNNLLQNAVKYSYRTTPDSKHRYISIRGRPVRNGYELVFANFGVGIEPSEYDLIFQEGYKGNLTKPEYRTGSGQGLALTKRVIEGHHGTITPWSEPVGGGTPPSGDGPYLTRFTVWLPLKQPESKD
jgi:signal transduction histidine kinase